MRKAREFNWGWKLLASGLTMVLVLMLGLLAEPFSIVSNAQSQGKVIASSAKIRKETSTSSETLGSASQGASLTINHQVTGSDGKIWYQVFVDADTLGYIRSDLVEITDGTTPPTVSAQTSTSSTTTETTTETPANNTTSNENMAEVTAVEPVSATVTGSQSVRVRSNASTGSQIVTMAQNGLALTVTGQAEGTDGKIWYQVTFISNGSSVTGFIRSDYVALAGELLPVTEEITPPSEEEVPEEPVTPEVPVEVKDWDTKYEDGKWHLIDNVTPGTYEIDYIFDSVRDNAQMYEAARKEADSRQVWIIILVLVIIALVGVIAFLIYKFKDMKDSAYFAEIERETIRRRTADRPAEGSRNVMHTVGGERRQAQNGQRPMGARPAGAPMQNGQRPMGTGPAGAPMQNGQRPVGARPAGAPVQNGQRPMGARPAGEPMQNAQNPSGQNHGEQPARSEVPKPQQSNNTQNPGWQSKNFMTDEDEFEFEFLNWDGEDEQ